MTRDGACARGDARGAVLVYAAVLLLPLLGICALVVDHGVAWLARVEAQRAADAGALAGAVALAYDETVAIPPTGGPAWQSATAVASANGVGGRVPGVAVTWDCPPFITGTRCARVDVFRDGTHGSLTLPTYFAGVLGVRSMGTRATATAQALASNATTCLKPWAIPDLWRELRAPVTTFDRYVMSGTTRGQLLTGVVDSYARSPGGTGYSVAGNYGQLTTLKLGKSTDTSGQKGWYFAVSIPGTGGSGASTYAANIRTCTGVVTRIGDYLGMETGNMVGPTTSAVNALIALDPNAHWDGTAVVGGCSPACGEQSPRIVAVGIFDPDEAQLGEALNSWPKCPGGSKCVHIVNLIGFFVAGIDSNGNVTGNLMHYVGQHVDGGWDVGEPWTFSWSVRLVR